MVKEKHNRHISGSRRGHPSADKRDSVIVMHFVYISRGLRYYKRSQYCVEWKERMEGGGWREEERRGRCLCAAFCRCCCCRLRKRGNAPQLINTADRACWRKPHCAAGWWVCWWVGGGGSCRIAITILGGVTSSPSLLPLQERIWGFGWNLTCN